MRFQYCLILWLLSALAQAQQPFLNERTAFELIDTALQQEPLLWMPFPLPYEIDRASQDKDARLLEALFDHDLVQREKVTRMVEVTENGVARRKVRVGWRYVYPASREIAPEHRTVTEGQTQQGFYYGRRQLKAIMELTSGYRLGEYYYAEAYIQWFVADLQDWVDDLAFDRARTLRRSKESFDKPFEKRVYLMHDGDSWGFWNGTPGQL